MASTAKRFQVLDLFSGIGGFSLGLERAGMETVAFCEVDGFARRVLRRHWPGVWLYEDVKTLTAKRLRDDGLAPDLICGGFPCQDISVAGNGAGIGGARSGLWKEYHRLIREVRPRYAVMENVSALLRRGLDVVLGDLAEIGYDAEWHCIQASAVGAPHRRDRVWIVAHPRDDGRRLGLRLLPPGRRDLGDGGDPRRPFEWNGLRYDRSPAFWKGTEGPPRLFHLADGIPHGLDQLVALGNAVVPQIPELIGRAIIARERAVARSKARAS